MTTENCNKIMDDMIKKATDTLTKKTDEYATEDDRLHNFKVAAALEQVTPEQALFGFLAKHIVSLSDMILSGEEYSTERWDEKIGDSINYLLLLRALTHETGTSRNSY